MPDLLGIQAQAKAALQKASDAPSAGSRQEGSADTLTGIPSGAPSPTVERDVLNMTSRIVAAHVSNNAVESGDLPSLIEQVYETLVAVGDTGVSSSGALTPAVPIKNSVTPDYIICLEDGKKLKMLKRHLKTAYNLTPEEYRERWGLAADYPMVAPNYAKQRSRLAKQIGLGTKPSPR